MTLLEPDQLSEDDTSERATLKLRVGKAALDLYFVLGGASLVLVVAMENRLGSFGMRLLLILPGWALLSWGLSSEVAKKLTGQSKVATVAGLCVAGPLLGLLIRLALA